MADVYRFPNRGYDVVVCKKQDILDCIDKNITDKEVLIDIIKQCELDAANFIKQGRWTGIPFIGNIRLNQFKQLIKTEENQELLSEAKEVLNHEQYVMFRKQISRDTANKIKTQRYFNYIVSIAINRNKQTYRKLCKEKGEHFANVFLFANYHYTCFDRDLTIAEDE